MSFFTKAVESLHVFMERLTVRKPSLVYYGPHQCPGCTAMICRVSIEQGGRMYEYPDGPIYPNTEFWPHICAAQEQR